MSRTAIIKDRIIANEIRRLWDAIENTKVSSQKLSAEVQVQQVILSGDATPILPSMFNFSPAVTGLQSGRILVDWSLWPGLITDPNVSGYDIFCTTTATCLAIDANLFASYVRGSNFVISGLVGGTTYYVRVRPRTETGIGIESSIVSVAIPADPTTGKILVLSGDTWTDNSPSAGYIAWSAHTLTYNGINYAISAGNTNKKYIYWLSAGTSYTPSDTNPVLGDSDFVIAVNIAGAHDLAWNALANEVVNTAYVESYAITRGAEYYSGAWQALANTTEVEIGTITVTAVTGIDSIWLWGSAAIVVAPWSAVKGSGYCDVQIRIRKTNLTGTVVASAQGAGVHAADGDYTPIVLMAAVAIAAAGSYVYKLTAQVLYATDITAQVTSRTLLGIAKSR